LEILKIKKIKKFKFKKNLPEKKIKIKSEKIKMDEKIAAALEKTIEKVDFAGAKKFAGKVRDSFFDEKKRAIVVSDRISAFDFILGTIPFKGQILNQIAIFWFKKIAAAGIPTHFLNSPDPNISVVKNARVLPIEVIVRGFLTGSTKTSSWFAYKNFDRKICGIEMPSGMRKNQKFPAPIITPTTKPTEPGAHDEPISREEIISKNLVEKKIYEKIEKLALELFSIGQKIAAEKNLILVDTKYEFGLDEKNEPILIDEVHTPDSSRFWIKNSYEKNFAENLAPENLDKEFVRQKIVDAGYDVNSDENPKKFLTDEIRIFAAKKYLELFEKITGEKFIFPENFNAKNRIEKKLAEIFAE